MRRGEAIRTFTRGQQHSVITEGGIQETIRRFGWKHLYNNDNILYSYNKRFSTPVRRNFPTCTVFDGRNNKPVNLHGATRKPNIL